MAYTAAVTGATGFVATELVKQLLEKGYHVNATVRNKNDITKLESLINLGKALPGSIEFFEADLLEPGSFDAAFDGCDFIFHTASPFFIDANDPKAELVDPAVQGTRNVFSSAAKVSSLRRIVLTSSCAAIKGMNASDPPVNGHLYTEADWNSTSTIENGEAYWVSKVQAEKIAWELAKMYKIDLVTVLPEFIMGPLISNRTDGTSVGYMKTWAEGTAQSGAPVFADVRDVARAHVLAAENPNANGRYIVANALSTPPQLITHWLQTRFPEFEFQQPTTDTEEPKAVLDCSRAQRELGLVIIPVQSTIIDMVITMIELGIAQPVKKKVTE